MNVEHDGVVKAFRSIGTRTDAYSLWFAEGKTTLIPKPGIFSSENHRPITSLRSMAVLSSRAHVRRSREIRARSARERAAKPREK